MRLKKPVTKAYSIRLLITILLVVVLVPITLFSIANNIYAANYVQSQIIQSYSDSMRLFLKIIEDTYRKIELNLGALINQNLSDLFAAEGMGTSNELLLARQRLVRVFERDALLSGNMDMVFLYNRSSGRYVDVCYSPLSETERQAIRQSLTDSFRLGEGVDSAKWHIRRIGGESYIFRIRQISDSYLGTCISADHQLDTLHAQKFVAMNDAVFLDHEYRVVSGKLLGKPVTTSVVLDKDTFSQDGVLYYLVHMPLAKTELIMTSLIRSDAMLAGLRQFRRILVLLIALMLLLVPVLYLLINRFALRPLANLTKALKVFMSGDFSIRIGRETPVRELDIVGSAFNSMANEVTQLKILNYENQLEKQRITLQYYQLQIRPHFLINTLNMISTLAQSRNHERILDLSMFLAAYFRYLLHEKGTFVRLSEELQHAANYLDIQRLRYPDRLNVEMDVDETLHNIAVLPLMLQTFVENSILYAVSLDEVSTIRIRARLTADGRVEILVTDTGPGFPEALIDQAGEGRIAGESKHIGISNIRERLALAYRGEAELTILNPPEGGALVLIVIPARDYDDVRRADAVRG